MSRTRVIRFLALGMLISGLITGGKGLWIGGKAVVAQILLKRAWHATLVSGKPVKPWPWMDSWPVARLDVPRLHRSAIVLEGESGQALAFGPAHLRATPMPGTPGLSVIAAHKNTQFDFLKDLRKGDKLTLQGIDGQTLIYEMVAARIVDYRNSGITGTSIGAESELALVTCYPFDQISFGGPLRYVVYAKLTNRNL